MLAYVIAICACLNQAEGLTDKRLDEEVKDKQLADIQLLLDEVCSSHRSLLPSRGPIGVMEAFRKSKWRDSVGEAVRLLVNSRNPQQRLAGWQLAEEYGFRMGWEEYDIDQIVKDESDDVKKAAIHSIAATDAEKVGLCIDRFLRDPSTSSECKKASALLLPMIPSMSQREGLWLRAAQMQELRNESIRTFAAVSFSPRAVNILIEYLDDSNTIYFAVAGDVGAPSQVRVAACQSLRDVEMRKEQVVSGLLSRCIRAPTNNDVDFFASAMVTVHMLAPTSSEPDERLAKWYRAMPNARTRLLEQVNRNWFVCNNLETAVMSSLDDMQPVDKCITCRWLGIRRSSASLTAVGKLLRDQHLGVRVVAATTITRIDPLYDLSRMREELLNGAISSKSEFAVGFDTISDAIVALAKAGQSDVEAVKWLKQKRDAQLQELCVEALMDSSLMSR